MVVRTTDIKVKVCSMITTEAREVYLEQAKNRLPLALVLVTSVDLSLQSQLYQCTIDTDYTKVYSTVLRTVL